MKVGQLGKAGLGRRWEEEEDQEGRGWPRGAWGDE